MKEISKAFKKAITDEFDGYLKTIGFKRIRQRADKDGFSIIYRCGERYLVFGASLEPRAYPFFYAIALGEGSHEFPDSDWNAIPIFLLIKDLADFEKSQEVFSIEYDISNDQIVQKIKAARELLEKHGNSFLENNLEQFRNLRAAQNRDREPYKLLVPQADGTYKMEYEKHSSKLKEKYSK